MLIIDNEFVQEYKPLIYKILGEQGRKYNKEEMQSLFVDTVIKLLQNATYYNGEYSIGTFIGLQVRSAVSDFTSQEVTVDAMGLVVTDEIPEEPVTEGEETPLERLQESVAPYLSYLSEVEQEVFIDRVYRGMSVEATAEHRELHVKSVSRIMKRAHERLTTLLRSGKPVSPMQEVETGVPLRHAIKPLLSTKHYHAFRLRFFERKSLIEISKLNGQTPEANSVLIAQAKKQVEDAWGIQI